MSVRVLLVDDDVNVLAGYRRQLRKGFRLETAESGAQGLEVLAKSGPFAVAVSDMRMPGMDGIAFLAEVKRRSPETVGMMLTGNADLQTCIDAVNEGHIFRFLTKPCSPEAMAKAIEAGIEQYRLIMAEHELIQGTLTGCIRTLTDILGVINPAGFSRGTRIRRYVRHIAAQLNAPHLWEYEMAAALSQIGCVALPAEILARLQTGRPLPPEQRAIASNHPAIGCQLLAEIPRLGLVALMIQKQNTPPKDRVVPRDDMPDEQVVALGAQILRVALDLDRLMLDGLTFIQALSTLHSHYGPDHPLVEALMSFQKDDQDKVILQVKAAEVTTQMVAAEDICAKEGAVILAKGGRITKPMVFHLQSCAQTGSLKEPFLVEVIAEASQ